MMVENNICKSERGVFKSGGLYVHMAYCRRKCIYCDFYSVGERIADWHRYVEALCSEFRHRLDELVWPLRTVYFGGGTPSLMPEEDFLNLCGFLRPFMADVEEFTMEVNPDDVNRHLLEVWMRGGVNRISMGIQSFDDKVLKVIGRRHDSKDAIKAYREARTIFSNISVDLMYGLPGQTLDIWSKDLQTVINLRPEHISAYSLMYEDGTALTALRDKGRISEASEELTVRMFLMLIDELSKAGYEQYEISNFALPGRRSIHNSSYWKQLPYIGIGPSAHSYDGLAVRRSNHADIKEYLEYWAPGQFIEKSALKTVADTECLSAIELMEEYILTRIRIKEGIPLLDFGRRFGDQALSRLIRASEQLRDENLINNNETNISLTQKAILLSDSIILELTKFD